MNELYNAFSAILVEYLKRDGLDDIKTADSLEDVEANFMIALSSLIDYRPKYLQESLRDELYFLQKRLRDELYFFVIEYVYAVPWNTKDGTEVLTLYEYAQADAKNGRAFSCYEVLAILYTKDADHSDLVGFETLAEAVKGVDFLLKSDSGTKSILIINNK